MPSVFSQMQASGISGMEESLRPGDISGTFLASAPAGEVSWNDLSRKIQNTEKEASSRHCFRQTGIRQRLPGC